MGTATATERGLRHILGTAWVEFSWLWWVIPFRLAWLLTVPLKIFWPSGYTKVNYRLIELLNRRLAGRSKHLAVVRAGSKDLATYWQTYDGSPDDIALYGRAAGRNDWYLNKTILDVGCGVGRKSYELAKAGAARVLGVDTSARNIEVAQQMGERLPNLEFRRIDAAELKPEFSNVFDYIISFTVFEHVDNVAGLLHELYTVQKPGGKNIIVYNHYLDRYGSHLKEFIYFPWPQLIWPESLLFAYWNEQLRLAHGRGEMGYFPPDYQHGTGGHNNDCFMNLNKHSIADVRRLIATTPYRLVEAYAYSASPLLTAWPWIRKSPIGKYLEGSIAYVLEKPI